MLTAEPKAYGSNWYATTRVDSPRRPQLSVELDVEVCVIGAGLAGLTLAREVARLGWTVVVLEAKSIAWSASGRGLGVVAPGFSTGVDALIQRVGLDAAKELWARSEAGAEYVRTAARGLPGVALNEGGWLHVSRTDRTAELAHEAALLVGEFGADVEPWPADRVHEALRSERYFHGLHYPRGFSLHPLNYALGLAGLAEVSGARIFEDTPVLEIDPAGVRKRVVTSHSRVRAAHIVLAGGVHMTELAPQFATTLLPTFSTCIITAPLGEDVLENIRYPGAVSEEADLAGHHYRVTKSGRLIWCGPSSARLGPPQRQGQALIRQIRRIFPALRGVKVEHAWIGVTGHTVHGMPQIGEITPGLWLLNGFGGHGLNTTAMAGEMLARAIVNGDRGWEMFSSFPLVWAGGTIGRMAQQASEWSRGVRETVGGMLARRRTANKVRTESVAPAPSVAPPMAPASPPEPEPVIEPMVAPAGPSVVVIPEPEPVVVAEASPLAVSEVASSEETKEQLRSILNELTEPNLPKRPKRGPKKRGGGGIPAILRDFAAPPGQGDKGAAPHSPTEEPQAPQPPFDDRKP